MKKKLFIAILFLINNFYCFNQFPFSSSFVQFQYQNNDYFEESYDYSISEIDNIILKCVKKQVELDDSTKSKNTAPCILLAQMLNQYKNNQELINYLKARHAKLKDDYINKQKEIDINYGSIFK
jgi:hypothetical protein